jgi:hypothetical protein
MAIVMILKNSGLQFLWLFGSFIAGGLCLTFLSKWTNNTFRQFVFPKIALYVFAAIGIAVHELSHAFFCKLFLHKVNGIKLFDGAGKGGAQGSVSHSYHPWNPYHRIGHFFIGLGPAIGAPVLLALLAYALLPVSSLAKPFLAGALPHQPIAFIENVAALLRSAHLLSSIGFWVFSYLALCICSQVELSREDWAQVKLGCVPLTVLLLLVNLSAWCLGFHWNTQIISAGHWITTLTSGFFIYAAILSVANLVICTVVFSLLNLIAGRASINPFAS